ncbi:MAG: triose-phosphate isomerase [Chloroflexi bacterium]|nr:triose-phosphate isomerase [Chloroflexota bacterium]
MATPFIAGNWKMNTTVDEAVALVRDMRGPLEALNGITCVVCPPFVSLAAVAGELSRSAIGVAAQNMHPEAKGAFTGEVSPAMLEGLCHYVILGHSERRQLFGEDDAFINRKVQAALGNGLVPILCVGETLEEREAGKAQNVVTRQVREGLAGVDATLGGLVLAYEPVWAIGTGKAADGATAQEIMGLMRSLLRDIAGDATGEATPLLYGGSVTPDNVAEFAGQLDIDGALVGGASLRADLFVEIARAIRDARPG